MEGLPKFTQIYYCTQCGFPIITIPLFQFKVHALANKHFDKLEEEIIVK